MSLKLTDPVGFIKGATPSVRRAWESLGIKTIEDLLTTLPRRYDDFSQTVAIANTQNGDVVTIKGKVTQAKKMHTFRKNMSMTAVKLSDDTGTMTLTFFNQPWLLQEMVEGREIIVAGKVSLGRFGRQMTRPLWEPAEKATIAAGKIAPVYGLSGTLVQKTYRRLMQLALEQIEWPDDGLSEEWRSRYQLLAWQQAIKQAHEPETMDQAEKARKRLAFDELVTYQLALKSIMTETDAAGAFALPFDEQFAKKFVKELPFQLTDDQKIVAWKCINDMQLPKPMRRLIQGDVGSGKTVVAAFLAALVYRHGQSAALLAPTDILAKQHAETLIRFFAPFQIPLVLLTQKTKEYIHLGERKKLTLPDLDDVVKKGNQIIIGTHAIMVGSRLPKDLALAIVDEQHRFGVNQRETLAAFRRDDQKVPHFLSMTATPIPRSLALTLYGGLDVSLIHQKPSGRLPIKTTVCVSDGREQAYEAVRHAVARGEKAFIVCALIDASDVLGVRSVTDEFKRLQVGPLKNIRLGMLHGRMKAAEKDEQMRQINAGELDALIATSVIEVGVDVPKATVILIEGAERFGLAQLHQLRGRVGRSNIQSFCYLLTDVQAESLERLHLMEQISDGMRLAEEDLKIRGSGHLMGTTQSGHWAFQAARMTDVDIMLAAKECAEHWLKQDHQLESFPIWKEKVRRLQESSHLE